MYAHVTTSAKREAAKTMGSILSGAALLTLWVKCMSAEQGHGSKSRVHFLGYSLAPVGVSVWVRKNGK